jgi:hypothetical protein
MRDEGEDLRRVGRDEMNLCEFPIATLADRVPPGIKRLPWFRGDGRCSCRSVQYRSLRVGLP